MTIPEPLQQVERTYVRLDGRKLSYFAGCDYYRLASHPKVLRAVEAGLTKYGLNVSASRLTTGNHKLYGELEESLRRFFGSGSVTLASNGYAPGLITAQALAGQFSHAMVDERSHPALADAALLLDCPVVNFKHQDAAELGRLLKRLGKTKPLILTDGVFSHDGSIAPLKEYLQLLPPGGMILVDDAHGAGVLGAKGRGTPEYAGVEEEPERIIQTITLSKAFGVYGGAVLGPAWLRERIVSRSHAFAGTTPLPLPLANGAITSVELLRKDRALRRRLARHTQEFKQQLRAANVPTPETPAPIAAINPASDLQASRLKGKLLAAGIFPPFIKYPGGPENGYFRFVLSSEHTAGQMEKLVKVITDVIGV